MKKADNNFSVPVFYQRLFVAAAFTGWLVQLAFVVISTMGHGGPGPAAIWEYEMAAWGMPILFFALALLFMWKRYSGLKLLFSSTFVTTVGVLFYQSLEAVEQGAYTLYMTHRPEPVNGSFWTGQANVWMIMGVGTALFISGLYYLRKRKV